MRGMTMQLAQVRDSWAALDARDTESATFRPLIDSRTGYVRYDVGANDDADAADSLVIIDRARIADGWRGQGGIGRILIEQAISLVADPAGLCLVALKAHPYLDETEEEEATPEAVASTEQTWASMGFTRVEDRKLFVRSTAKKNLFGDVAKRLGLP
ncbi:hypothetical protein IC607_00880 [Cellulomonas sp. JH27-2]|uniref:hypothetical protein n=1 Tax=Cellulomonas sp. JH27-2 TaxID=2774139 RepID=UPI001783EFCB|nr:hypothetical protein [Cellulomonas sp. JH27-2]MBD8057523.1 hypothetical protein [Cellulomonas sp. JH27-2]